MAEIRCKVGVDIGGTFTDIIVVATNGAVVTRKLSSTTDDYARGIIVGLQEMLGELGLTPAAVEEIVHGTTIATNAILERRGVSTALITTAGFRDVLELQRIRIPELYTLFYEKPRPLVPRRYRLEVSERVGPDGEVWEPIDWASVESVIERIATTKVEAVAICFLNSYVNPRHEREVRDAVRAALPELFVTCSTDILAEMREYERTSTATINAYVGPIVKRYLDSLVGQLRAIGVDAPLSVMQCSGGVMSAEFAVERPAYLVESGPAAGVIAAAGLSKLWGYRDLITLDMGGTTAKASVVEAGNVTLTSDYEVGGGINLSSMLVKGGGYALKVPVVDVSEIGAGGGSMVWIDPGGRVRIGPQSAGAVPGPVCYGAGGQIPTVTDANVVLGYLNPEYLAGGRVRLDTELARAALEEQIARPLGLSVCDAAHGVFTLAASNMVRAVKAVSTYRGRDPRDYALVAFGGSGPVCAAEMAKTLQMSRVIVPPAAGLFSALGLLHATLEHQIVQTYLRTAGADIVDEVNAAFADLDDEASRMLARQGHALSDVHVARAADVRYADQGYELTISLPRGTLSVAQIDELVESFGDEHLRTYGHRAENEDVAIVNLRVTGRVQSNGRWAFDPQALVKGKAMASPSDRDAYFGSEYGVIQTPVVTRSDVDSAPMPGPVIVEEYDSTTVVPPRATVRVDECSNLVVEL